MGPEDINQTSNSLHTMIFPIVTILILKHLTGGKKANMHFPGKNFPGRAVKLQIHHFRKKLLCLEKCLFSNTLFSLGSEHIPEYCRTHILMAIWILCASSRHFSGHLDTGTSESGFLKCEK